MYRRSCHQDFSSNKLDQFSRTSPFVFCKKFSSSLTGNHPKQKGAQVSSPAIGLCRKILRFPVGGIFEHKVFFVCYYPLCSAYLRVFYAPWRSWFFNFEAKVARRHTRKMLKVAKKSARSCGRDNLLAAGQAMFMSLRSLVLSPSLSCSMSFRLWRQSLQFTVPMAIE